MDWTDHRLNREEANGRRNGTKVVRSECVTLILDGHTHPDIRRPRERRGNSPKALRSLCEDLVRVHGSLAHHIEHTPNELVRDSLME